MALQRTSAQNVFLDRGNSLAIYIDGKTNALMLKDSNGQIQPVSDYIGTSGNFILNQKSVLQDANFKIAGIGTIGDTSIEQALNVKGFFSLSDSATNLIIHTDNFPAEDFSGAANISIGNNNILQGNPLIQNNILIGQNIMEFSDNGVGNIAIGNAVLQNNRGGANIAIGSAALNANIEGNANIVIGEGGLQDNVSGTNNISIGNSTESNNFNNVLILGSKAKATQSNQIIIGSVINPLGTVTLENVVSDNTLEILLNGVKFKILLKEV